MLHSFLDEIGAMYEGHHLEFANTHVQTHTHMQAHIHTQSQMYNTHKQSKQSLMYIRVGSPGKDSFWNLEVVARGEASL